MLKSFTIEGISLQKPIKLCPCQRETYLQFDTLLTNSWQEGSFLLRGSYPSHQEWTKLNFVACQIWKLAVHFCPLSQNPIFLSLVYKSYYKKLIYPESLHIRYNDKLKIASISYTIKRKNLNLASPFWVLRWLWEQVSQQEGEYLTRCHSQVCFKVNTEKLNICQIDGICYV